MAIKKSEMIVYFYEIPNIKKYWSGFIALGTLLSLIGILSIAYASYVTEFTVFFFGLLLIGAGVLLIASGTYAQKWTGFSSSLLLGIFYLIAGCLCVVKPIQSAYSISLLIASLLLVGGAFRIVSAIIHRFDNWDWVVFNGLVAMVLGVLIFVEWPVSAMWVIGVYIGVDLLLMGWYWVRLGLAAKE